MALTQDEDDRSMSPLVNRWWTVPGLFLMTWLVYAQVQEHDFVNYDDDAYSSHNRYIVNGLTKDSVSWAFSFASSDPTANWFPLTWLSLMLDADLYGTDAGGFHRTNVVIHTINVLLVLLALHQLTGEWAKSAFVAAVFAVHPLNVETVSWVSERKGLLSTCFGLLTLWAYARYASVRRIRWLLVSLVAYALSLMSKQMFVTLPFLLLLLDYWPLRRFATPGGAIGRGTSRDRGLAWRRLLLEKTPFVLIAAVFCVVAVMAQRRGDAIETLERLPVTLRLSNAVVAYMLYVLRVIWPVGLSVHYPHPGQSISQVSVVVACLLLCLITMVAVRQRKTRPFLLVGWLWFLGMLVPVIGIVQIGIQQMADRYAYVPTIGLFVAIAWLVPSLLPLGDWRRNALLLGSGLTLTGLSLLSYIQASYWWDSITLFEHALVVTEKNTVAHTNLGEALLKQERSEEAIEHFQAAIKIDPRFALAHNNLGVALLKRGQYGQSMKHFQDALRIAPDYRDARINVGIALCFAGDRPAGVEQFRQVLQKKPDNLRAHVCLAWVLPKLGLTEEAKEHAEYVRAQEADTYFPSLSPQFEPPATN